MATMIPVAAQAMALFQTASSIANVLDDSSNSRKEQDMALQQLQQQQLLQQRQSAQDAALDKKELQAKAEAAEKERRAALKRAMARQRAQYGGSGIASGDGSSEAVLLGMFEESDVERQSRERLDKLREQSLEQNLLQQKNVNTLKRTQLAERQRLSNSGSTLDDMNALLKVF